jgi:hypothetical protein
MTKNKIKKRIKNIYYISKYLYTTLQILNYTKCHAEPCEEELDDPNLEREP